MTHYDILGVAPTASSREITRAFRRRIKQVHPDLVSNPSEKARREAETKRLILAYTVLRDRATRAAYDRLLATQRQGTAETPRPGPKSQPGAQRGPQPGAHSGAQQGPQPESQPGTAASTERPPASERPPKPQPTWKERQTQRRSVWRFWQHPTLREWLRVDPIGQWVAVLVPTVLISVIAGLSGEGFGGLLLIVLVVHGLWARHLSTPLVFVAKYAVLALAFVLLMGFWFVFRPSDYDRPTEAAAR
jgi:hypothetical protein